jgi:CheY-like chemotaxis protein
MSSSASTSSSLRVLIVDHHEVSRGAIRALLWTEGLDVVADVATLDRALAVGESSSPDVVILDISSRPDEAIPAANMLSRLRSAPTVLLTSSSPTTVELDGFAFVAKRDICASELRRALRPANHLREPRMSMQKYLDNITTKTGKTPDELIELARAAGVLEPDWKAGDVVAWLKERYGLGHGHAMAIVATIQKQSGPEPTLEDKVSRHFSGAKSTWRPVYDDLIQTVSAFGTDLDVNPGATYLSLRRAGKKFAIVQVTSDRLDVGIKLKDTVAAGRLEPAGNWNRMVTHRVRVRTPSELDAELVGWLERAYARA